MKISAICVCWNAAKTIRSTIESFLAQDYTNKELVIVDGVSTDGTLDIVRSFNSPLITLHSGKDKGIYDAMNKGLRLYSGDAVGFLNADDIYHSPKTLSLIAEGLKKAPVVFGNIDFVDSHLKRQVQRQWQPRPFKAGAFKKGWMAPHPTTYALRDVYDKVGGFDTAYKISGDYDWMIRVFEIHEYPSQHIPHILADMQLGGMSTSGLKASWVNLKETSRARRKWLNAAIVDKAMVNKVWNRAKRMALG